MQLRLLLLALLVLTQWAYAQSAPAPASEPAVNHGQLTYKFVYVRANLLAKDEVAKTLQLLQRAKAAGYNGIVLDDFKFMLWDRVDARYRSNVQAVRQACRDLGLLLVTGVMPVGYSDALLRHDPNLAAGLPVRDAEYVVDGDHARPSDQRELLSNGGFEASKGNSAADWSLMDQPGVISIIDRETVHGGGASLRLEDPGVHNRANGHARAMQVIHVRPFTQYVVSFWVKTADLDAPESFRVQALGDGDLCLSYFDAGLQKNQDWHRIELTFNSLRLSTVRVYLGCQHGGSGKIWLDDISIRQCGPINIVRRDTAPLRVASEDDKLIYEEGRDFRPLSDPLLGHADHAGNFTSAHEEPVLTLAPDSRIGPGQRLHVSYYHAALINKGQVPCSLSDEGVFRLLDWQIGQMQTNMAPDGFFMNHDEIRVGGWENDGEKTPGQLLAENVSRCTEIIRHQAGRRDVPIFVWSDMFDPFHNAHKDQPYYLVNGTWYGSWEGLPAGVIVANWHQNDADSLRFFAERGNRQILCGFYDHDPALIREWIEQARGVNGVIGVMYTSWKYDYSQLEAFSAAVDEAMMANESK